MTAHGPGGFRRGRPQDRAARSDGRQDYVEMLVRRLRRARLNPEHRPVFDLGIGRIYRYRDGAPVGPHALAQISSARTSGESGSRCASCSHAGRVLRRTAVRTRLRRSRRPAARDASPRREPEQHHAHVFGPRRTARFRRRDLAARRKQDRDRLHQGQVSLPRPRASTQRTGGPTQRHLFGWCRALPVPDVRWPFRSRNEYQLLREIATQRRPPRRLATRRGSRRRSSAWAASVASSADDRQSEARPASDCAVLRATGPTWNRGGATIWPTCSRKRPGERASLTPAPTSRSRSCSIRRTARRRRPPTPYAMRTTRRRHPAAGGSPPHAPVRERPPTPTPRPNAAHRARGGHPT